MAFVCGLIQIGLHITILESAGIRTLEYKSVNQSSKAGINDGPQNALDNDTYTCALTKDGYNQSWTVTFEQNRRISCFTIILRGGTYTILVQNYEPEQSVSECSNFQLAGLAEVRNHDICCTREHIATKLMVVRLGKGALRLYEMIFKGCDEGRFGMNCTKCSDSCATCDAATGSCTSCNASRYGKMCERECPQHCSNGSCNFKTGVCSSCENGYTGPRCHPCKPGNYGINCTSICPKGCRTNCSIGNGTCLSCESNYYRPSCMECKITNCVKCINSSVCDHCNDGWYGANCSDMCQHHCISCSNATLCTTHKGNNFSFSTNILSTNTMMTSTKPTKPKSSNSKDGADDMNTLLVALLFTSILLLLLLILFFIKRYKRNEMKQHSSSTRQCDNTEDAEAIPLRLPIGNESTTVILEELDHSEEIPQQPVQFLDVEYTNTIANRVSVDNFIKIYDDLRERNENEADEFIKIPSGLMELHTQALKTENMSRNRYKHVYPYDFCRVVLDTGNGTKGTDYINACFVEGFSYEKAYIAAQGPFTPETLEDFWRMIWEYDCTRIVMLTNLYEGEKMKCLKYWPEDEIDFGEFDIKVETQDMYEMYTIRYLSATKNMERKRVTQFHFTGWPDCNVPESVESLLCFRDLVKNGIASSDGPIVVHCSAGIGRTGTFIALDYLLEEGISTDHVDVINCVSKLRQQRAHSIQTKEQYVFLYDALAHGLKTFRRKSLYHVVDEM